MFSTLFRSFEHLLMGSKRTILMVQLCMHRTHDEQNAYPRPPQKFCDKRKTLCLDMDDTLTYMTFERVRDSYSGELREYDAIVTAQDNPEDWGMVYFRPYLRTFLEAVSKVFEVVVFTAACREYADQILDAIDPENKLFHHRLYRESCKECIVNPSVPDAKVYVKDLRVLGRDLKDIILVDNSLLCFSYQLDNGVVCNPFKGASDDTELIAVLEVLTIIDKSPNTDVRRIFKRMYGLTNIIAEYSAKGGRHGIKRHPTALDSLLDTPVSSNKRLIDMTEPEVHSSEAIPQATQSSVYPKSGLRDSGRHELDPDNKNQGYFPRAQKVVLPAVPAPPIFINTILPGLEPIPTPIQSLYANILNSNFSRQSLIATPRPEKMMNVSAKLGPIAREYSNLRE